MSQDNTSNMSADNLKKSATLAYRAKDFNTALRLYTQAAILDPGNMVYSLNKGAVHLEADDFHACIEECTQAIALGTASFSALLNVKPPDESDAEIDSSTFVKAAEFSQREKNIRAMLYKAHTRMGKALLLTDQVNEADIAFGRAVGVTSPQFVADSCHGHEASKIAKQIINSGRSTHDADASTLPSTNVPREADVSLPPAGARVKLQGLSNEKFNGILGTVTAVTADGSRLIVQLDSTGKDIRVKVKNTTSVATTGNVVGVDHPVKNNREPTVPVNAPARSQSSTPSSPSVVSASSIYTVMLSAFRLSLGADVTVSLHVDPDQKPLSGQWGHIVTPSTRQIGKAAVRIVSQGEYHGLEVYVRPDHLVSGHDGLAKAALLSNGHDSGFHVGERVRLHGVHPQRFNGLAAVILDTAENITGQSNDDHLVVAVELPPGSSDPDGSVHKMCIKHSQIHKIVKGGGSTSKQRNSGALNSLPGRSAEKVSNSPTTSEPRGKRDISTFLGNMKSILQMTPLSAQANTPEGGALTDYQAKIIADWDTVCKRTQQHRAPAPKHVAGSDNTDDSTDDDSIASAPPRITAATTARLPVAASDGHDVKAESHANTAESSVGNISSNGNAPSVGNVACIGNVSSSGNLSTVGTDKATTSAADAIGAAAASAAPSDKAASNAMAAHPDAGHVLHDGMLHDDMDDDEFVTFEELLQQFKDEDEAKRRKKLNRKKSKQLAAQNTPAAHDSSTAPSRDEPSTETPVGVSAGNSKTKRKRKRKKANATKCVTTAASEDVLSETGAVLSPSGHAVPSIEDGTSANQAGRPGVRTESKQDTLPPNTDQRIERANTDKSSYSRQDHDGTRENAKAKESAATQLSRIHKLKARQEELHRKFRATTLTVHDVVEYEDFVQAIGNAIGGDRTRLIQQTHAARATLSTARSPKRVEALKEQMQEYAQREIELQDELVLVRKQVETYFLSATCQKQSQSNSEFEPQIRPTRRASHVETASFETQMQNLDLGGRQ